MAHTSAILGLTKPNSIHVPQISFSAKDINFADWKGDFLAVAVSEKDMLKDSDSMFENLVLKKLDDQLGCLLAEASAEEDFTGKSGQSTVLRLPGLGFRRPALIGIGKCSSSSSSNTSAYSVLVRLLLLQKKTSQASNAAIVLASPDELSPETKLDAAYSVASGTILGAYEDTRFKSESKKPSLKSLDIFGLGSGAELEKKLKYVNDVCDYL